ncbi:MAG: hypothetical protein JXR76_13555, partial [Deltaproteobacteria bacterium]|nr:hypothetical protein [Deltaproteobacteria bacterium]
ICRRNQFSAGDKPRALHYFAAATTLRLPYLDKWLRDAIKRYKEFVSSNWEALKEWKKGNRDILFPAGTYAIRILSGVNVSPG